MDDVWDNKKRISKRSNEHTGYPTQKSIDPYLRMVNVSSNEGDIVLDPFCGSGTTLEACHRLSRKWIGIDFSELAVETCIERLHEKDMLVPDEHYELHVKAPLVFDLKRKFKDSERQISLPGM